MKQIIMKKNFSIALTLFLSIALLMSGCVQLSAKERLSKAFIKTSDMASFKFSATVGIGVDLPASLSEENPMVGGIYAMFKDFEIKLDGIYQKDPQQMEMTLAISTKGDTSMTINVPMVVTKDKAWIKVPSIPFFPIPEDKVGKFVEIDLAKYNEEAAAANSLNLDLIKEFATKLLGIVVDGYGTDTFTSLVDSKEAGIPDSANVKYAAQVQLTNENIEEAITILLNDVAPKILTLASDKKWMDAFKIKQTDLDQAKTQLDEAKKDVKTSLVEVKKDLDIKSMKIITGIDKDDYITHQSFKADVVVNQNGEKMGLRINLTENLTDINKKAEFVIGIPAKDQTIAADELMN
jgi:hypothetical protein